MNSFKFGKSRRIRTNNRFREIMAARHCFYEDVLVVFIMKNGQDYSRAGISVGKRFGNAVRRNRLKRLLREAFRQSQDSLPQGYDFILMYNSRFLQQLREKGHQVEFSRIQEALKGLTRKINKQINVEEHT